VNTDGANRIINAHHAIDEVYREINQKAGKATDDDRIARVVTAFGGEAVMTDPALPNTVWQAVGFSSRASVNIDNLTIGQYYWFRVKAAGTRKNSGFSAVALVMAA